MKPTLKTHRIAWVLAAWLALTLQLAAAAPKPALYISFDKDFDGAGKTGHITGEPEGLPQLVPGKVGQAMKSGPGTGYLQFPTKDIINPAEGTVEMWVCPLDWKPTDHEFHVFFDVLKSKGLLCLYKYWELVGLLMLSSEKDGGPYYNNCMTLNWQPGEWHHIAGTWSKQGVWCFVDGQPATQFPAFSKLPSKLGPMFRIGDNPWPEKPRTSSSLVDEVRVYDRALSPAHIVAHYQGNYDYSAPLNVKQMRLNHSLDAAKYEAAVRLTMGSPDVEDARLKVKMAIRPKGTVLPKDAPDYPVTNGQVEQTIQMPCKDPGDYEIVAKLYEDGKEFTELRRDVILPDVKKWQGNQIGLEDKVLPPWTPMAIKGKAVRCWGREYSFDGTPLPTRIQSADQELLTRPVALNATMGGQPVQWSAKMSKGKLSSPGTSFQIDGILKGVAGDQTLNVKVANTIEYDGLDLVTLSIPGNKGATLDQLNLEIPMSAQRALYRHRYAWEWDQRSASFLPKGEGVVDQDKFIPYYWLGDNDRGLFWMCESDQMWPNGQDAKAMEIVRRGDEVLLRINLLANGQKLPSDWRFVFGLQATPVRPLAKDWRKWRFTPGRNANLDIIWPSADRKDCVRYFGYPEAMVPDQPFIDRVSSLHRNNIKAVPYLCLTWLSEGCPEWPFFGKAWRLPTDKVDVSAGDVQAYGAMFSPVSPIGKGYPDFIVWKTKQFVEQYGVDGAYHDNSSVFAVDMPEGGLGYVRDGKNYPTYPLLAYRQLYRRIYSVYKSQPRETFTIAHMSRTRESAFFTYEDAVLGGEHFRGRVQDSYMDLMSLDTFRAEMMGRQWGTIFFFLPEFGGDFVQKVEPTRGMMALLMLHDVSPWPIWCNEKVINEAFEALDQFGHVDADFIGYFDEKPPATTDMKDVYVSAYKRPDQKVLLIVSNLSREDRKGTVAIDTGRIGVPLKKVVTWPDKQPVTVAAGKVQLAVPKLGYRMLVVENPEKP